MSFDTQKSRKPDLWALILILAIALAVRIVYLYQFSQLPDWEHLTVDNNYHINWATSIANGNLLGDTTYFRAPLYVFALALIIKLFGVSLWAFRIFGLLIGLGTLLLVYQTSLQYSGVRAARLAALLYALFPIAVYFESELLLDSLFTFLLLAAWYATLRASENRSGLSLLIAGFLWGLSAITRPTSLILLPLSLWPLLKDRENLVGRRWRNSLILVLGTAAIVGAVAVRNIVVASDPVLISSQAGINLYIGNNPIADGVSAELEEPLGLNWRVGDISYIAEKQVGRELKSGEVSEYWMSRAIAWIVEYPAEAGQLYLAKLSFFFSNQEISNNRSLDRFLQLFPFFKYNPISFGLLFVFGTFGFICTRKRFPELLPVALIVVIYAVVISLFFVTSRFRLPVIPFIIILGASVAGMTRAQFKTRRWHGLVAGLLVSVISFVPIGKVPQGTPVMDYISRGLSSYARQEYLTALQLFQEGRAIDTTFPDINLNCGAAFFRMGELDSASYYFEREIAANPQRHAAYTNLASLLFLNDKPEQAQSLATQAISLRPYDIDANIILVRSAAASDHVAAEQLQSLLDSAVTRTSGDIGILLESGIAALRHGQYMSAERFLRAATLSSPPPIETDDFAFDREFRNSEKNRKPLYASAHYQLSYLLGLSGRYSDAVYEAHRAIELDSSLVEAYVNLVTGYLAMGKSLQADSVLQVAENLFPRNPLLQRFK